MTARPKPQNRPFAKALEVKVASAHLRLLPLKRIDVRHVELPKRTDPRVVALVESITEVGQLAAVLVDEKFKLIFGRHRYVAMLVLGLKEIEVKVSDLDDLGLRLARIDENLIRQVFTALERADQLEERKQIYEALHPTAKQGGAPGKKGGGKSKGATIAGFAKDTAAKTGTSERIVQQYVQVATKLDPKAKHAIKETAAADSITDLTNLARLEPEKQRQVAARVVETGETVKQAAKSLKRAEQVALAKVYVPPAGQFEVIATDWPWEYEDALDGAGMDRPLPFPPMKIDEICASIEQLPVAENCVLFAWVTNPILLDPAGWAVVAAKLRERWGFVAKQIRTWVKTNDADQTVTKQGWVWRGDTEHLIRLERGKPVFLPTGEKHGNPIQRTSFRAPIGEHSEKPDVAYTDIEKICASASRLEMYARRTRPGWVTTGSELPNGGAPEITWRPTKDGLGFNGKGTSGRSYVVYRTDKKSTAWFAADESSRGGRKGPFVDLGRAQAWCLSQEGQPAAPPPPIDPGPPEEAQLVEPEIGVEDMLVWRETTNGQLTAKGDGGRSYRIAPHSQGLELVTVTEYWADAGVGSTADVVNRPIAKMRAEEWEKRARNADAAAKPAKPTKARKLTFVDVPGDDAA